MPGSVPAGVRRRRRPRHRPRVPASSVVACTRAGGKRPRETWRRRGLCAPPAAAVGPGVVGALSRRKGPVRASRYRGFSNQHSQQAARRQLCPGHAGTRTRGGRRMSFDLSFLDAVGWLSLAYLLGINVVYVTLNFVSFVVLRRYQQRQTLGPLSTRFSNLELPVTLIIPAYNEEATVAATVRSLLQLNYSHFEIVVVNDGSSDRTLDVLKESFALRQFPEVVRRRLATEPLRGVYRSATHPELKVIDKHNGGKADALNAGINVAQYPLFCALDADGVLRPDSLRGITRPFQDDPNTVAAGGIIRIANGCDVVNGWLVRTGLPRNPLALLQVVEYCRAFLFGRLGWNPVNGLLVVSGAFGVFHKETVIEAGGYRRNTIGEDMELVVRLHRVLSREGRPYRIVFAPEPVCWTEAPESLVSLRSQRVRWQRGLCESLWLNAQLLFSRRGGWAGWVAFPFALI